MHIYRGKEIKAADAAAEKRGMDTFTLMENAGRSLFMRIREEVSRDHRILILAGKGNNGGDGIVLARYLKNDGYHVDLTFPLGKAATPVAKKHLLYFENCGYSPTEKSGEYDVIVDSLLGVGTRLPLPNDIVSIIDWINHQQAMVIAVDVPTGVLADTGNLDTAVKADWTLSLHGLKPSAFQAGSAEHYGKKEALDIGLKQESNCRIWTKEDVKRTYLKRKEGSHKGTYGTGLLVAGSDEMPGSSLLASVGAMRAGIGKLTVATTAYVSAIIAGRVPECTYLHDGLSKIARGHIPEGMKAAAIGPGLNEPEVIEEALRHLLDSELPVIVDAGALKERNYPKRNAPIILTPHPGEFSKMTGIPIKDIQQNRIETARSYAQRQHVTVVLKGSYTVIAFPDGKVLVNETGNAGLAKGGTGDTLTGILLAFVSSYSDYKAAVANAVYLHGASADAWKESKAMAAMLAGDVSENLAAVMKEFE
ncbi:bifunctional ADP-dependent NAD(P)H-hydrate dehydratase/NAD(P)H-hydrate epimerase [Bacillus testis]|uniref:bifunctional ADP-dependent NAD(P)H-hydrate dehydratase/NAD(P)H-hydrate epimerase n=1 Tax=Bacillus testis TaxID=1622072 RepID=UPI00067EB0E3|nr:bifunctional ADP-dependent NAD(P)H-hydrate dehydratase/NAD(P)H-hydrate epimerase [Bacillus testis]